MDDRYDFENFEEDNEKFLTCSERQYLIKNMLEHVVCDDENIKHVVGYHKIRVYKGRPISKYILFYTTTSVYRSAILCHDLIIISSRFMQLC